MSGLVLSKDIFGHRIKKKLMIFLARRIRPECDWTPGRCFPSRVVIAKPTNYIIISPKFVLSCNEQPMKRNTGDSSGLFRPALGEQALRCMLCRGGCRNRTKSMRQSSGLSSLRSRLRSSCGTARTQTYLASDVLSCHVL